MKPPISDPNQPPNGKPTHDEQLSVRLAIGFWVLAGILALLRFVPALGDAVWFGAGWIWRAVVG